MQLCVHVFQVGCNAGRGGCERAIGLTAGEEDGNRSRKFKKRDGTICMQGAGAERRKEQEGASKRQFQPSRIEFIDLN